MLDPANSFELYDGTRHKPQRWEATEHGLWPSKVASEDVDGDDSGICSPPMWTTSPPHRKNTHRSLSPTSRTQAIVRGQRELMEMVKNMPESNYELSLKDLVEHHHHHHREQDNNTVEQKSLREKSGARGIKVDNKVKRNGNIDLGGLYLKMGLPFSLGSKDKKKTKKNKNDSLTSGNGNTSTSRVTPKPDGSTKGGVDKEWWSKIHLASKDSDSGESSINSESGKSSTTTSTNSTSSRSNSRREKSGRHCWPFIIRRPKSRTKK